MKTLSEAETKKLPQWALHHISLLVKEIEHLQRQISDVTESVGIKTEISWRDGLDDERYLPQHSSVNFSLSEEMDDGITIRVDQQPGKNVLIVRGDGVLQIVPQAANTIHIKMED